MSIYAGISPLIGELGFDAPYRRYEAEVPMNIGYLRKDHPANANSRKKGAFHCAHVLGNVECTATLVRRHVGKRGDHIEHLDRILVQPSPLFTRLGPWRLAKVTCRTFACWSMN